MSGLFILLCAVAGAGSGSLVVDEHFDLIEVNHYHDANGRRVLDQAIFYRWSPEDGRFRAHAWRLIRSPGQLPIAAPGGGYICVWHDDGVLRAVRASQYYESWSQVDSEKENRKYFPQNLRSELAKRVPRLLPEIRDASDSDSRPRARIADEGLDDGTSRR